jgi:membrane protein
MGTFLSRMKGAIARVIPGCLMQGQAVAFNMFLAFFPMLLLVLGLLSTWDVLRGEAAELPQRLRLILPPGSDRLVTEYLVRRGSFPTQWILLGMGGTLLAGTQVMVGFMDGFRQAGGDGERQGFFARQFRALVLLCLTIGPWLAMVVLSMFGRQLRAWLIREYGLPNLIRHVEAVLYIGGVLLLGFVVLTVIYRVGRPRQRGWKNVAPGAAVATLLWWLVDVSFGFYVIHMPYRTVYGSLTAAIGLLLWMYLSAMVVFLGAAYNAESRAGWH